MGEATDKPVTSSPGTDNTPSTAQIKSEIAQTRTELGHTIDALQERLRPQTVIGHARDAMRDTARARIRQLGDKAGETAEDVATATRHAANRIASRAQTYPTTTVLIGVGLATVAAATAWARSQRSAGGWDRTEWGMPDAKEFGGRRFADQARETDVHRDQLLRTRTRAAEARSNKAMTEVVSDNPFAMGVAALVAGFVVGLSIPGTEMENQVLGERRDALFDNARGMVRQAAEQFADNV